MTRSDFATLAGVSRAAITLAIKRGNLPVDEDGNIDPEHPSVRLYLQTQNARRVQSDQKPVPPPAQDHATAETPRRSGPKTKHPRITLPDLPDPDDVTDPQLDEIDFDRPELYVNRYPDPASRDKVAATLKRLVEIKRHQQALRKEAGDLIERDYVASRFASFGEALRQQLLTMPRRTAPQLVARARAEGERAVEEYMADEIGAAIERALEELGIE